MIKLNNVNKYYFKGKENEIHVINDVSISLGEVGLVSFLGPSGSGKTTLLNVIGGLDKASGVINYDDVEIKKFTASKYDKFRSKEIGYIFQNYNILTDKTVYDNLVIALEIIGITDKNEQEKRIEYALKTVGMFKYRKKLAYALSGGQQQRVSIARALIKDAKIIIADEPTGNLDSDNTIEVMKILKKISKKSLVLLVTHNEELANFYSDRVICLNDGKIVNDYNISNDVSLDIQDSNTVYLKDVNKEEIKKDNCNIQLFNFDDADSIDLVIVKKGNSYYIESSKSIKFVSQSNLKLVDAHYEALKKDDIAEADFDTTWYNDAKSKENIFKKFAKSIKNSYFSFRNTRKRTKFLYISFFILGMMFALAVAGYSTFSTVDDTEICANSNYSSLDTDYYIDYSNYSQAYYKGFKEGYIEDAQFPITIDFNFYKKVNYAEELNVTIPYKYISYNDNVEIKYGKKPLEKQILISLSFANILVENYPNFFPNVKSVIGFKVVNTNRGGLYEIVGIVNATTPLSYMNDKDYLEQISEDIKHTNTFTFREYLYENIGEKSYTIVAGRDFIEEDLNYDAMTEPAPIILPYNYSSDAYDRVGQVVGIRTTDYAEDLAFYYVVGLYKLNNYETIPTELLLYSKYPHEWTNFSYSNSCAYRDYNIVIGRDVSKYNECIASVYSPYRIGDIIGTAEVVGLYNSTLINNNRIILFHRDYVVVKSAMDVWFQVKDLKSFKEVVLEESELFQINNTYNYVVEPLKEDKQSTLLVFGLFSIGLIISLSIFIYFMMRSKMTSDIYTVGVYRALGSSKKVILLKFLLDTIVMVTFTVVLGYLITLFIYGSLSSTINDMLGKPMLSLNFNLSMLGVLFIYLLTSFFGLIPVLLLLQKTPSEILSKYDI